MTESIPSSDDGRSRIIRARFDELLALPPEKRQAFIASSCAEDAALADELHEMLAMHEEEIIEPPSLKTSLDANETISTTNLGTGDTIGSFKILELLGEGGFGEVYLAQQTEPVRRRVALKIIKLGMDTKSVLARFEAERQAVAMMDDPGIARVYEAGATPEGRPYFAMEYVKGEPITAYCDREKLDTTQRLELFIKVCDAIQHAHQKGVIHRDIKPGNILVTIDDRDQAQPKIIDFGIAKATTQQLTEKTLHTQQGMLIGTPEYMSPEQAEMNAANVDTRSDVYSLGVLLYELLTGKVPFDPRELRKSGVVEIQRIIREDAPPRPSTRLTTVEASEGTRIAEARRTRLAELQSTLRRELEWIPLKALRKARTERYSSAEALGEDVRRYLTGEPLEAGPESLTYRTSKLIRRYRKTVITTAAIQVALLGGFLTLILWSGELTKTINRERNENENLTELLTADELVETLTKLPGEFDLAGNQYDFSIAAQRFKPDSADPMIQKTIDIYVENMALSKFAQDTLYLVDVEDLADRYRRSQGQDQITQKDALDWARTTLTQMVFEPSFERLRAEAPESPELTLKKAKTLNAFAARVNLSEQALESAEIIVDCTTRITPTDPFEIARARQRVANAMSGLDRFEDGLAAYEEVLKTLEQIDSTEESANEKIRTQSWYTLVNRGDLYTKMGRFDRALTDFSESYALCSNDLERTDMNDWSLMKMAETYSTLGRHEEAIEAASKCSYASVFFNDEPIHENEDIWKLAFGLSILNSCEGTGDTARAARIGRKLCLATEYNNNAQFMSSLNDICERAERLTGPDQ